MFMVLLRLDPPGELPLEVLFGELTLRNGEVVTLVRLSTSRQGGHQCTEADFPIAPPNVDPIFSKANSADDLAKLLEMIVHTFEREGWESSRLHLTEEHRDLPDLFVDPETGEVPMNVNRIDASQIFCEDRPTIGWVQPYCQSELLNLQLVRQRCDSNNFLVDINGDYFRFYLPNLTIDEVKQIAEAIRTKLDELEG